MPLPTSIDDLSVIPGDNFPQGTDSPDVLDNVIREHAAYIAELRDGQDSTIRDDLASTASGKGAEMVAFKQSGTGAVDRTASDKLREVVSVKDFGAVGDGVTDDTAAIQAALNSGAKALDFGPHTYRLKSGGYLIAANRITLISSGATFIQETWGIPGIEVRAAKVKMLGHWNFEYLGSRSAVISANTLGYAYVVSGNWKDYGSAIYCNNLNGYSTDEFHIDSLRVFGFINSVWFNGSRCHVGRLECDTTDMGVVGSSGDDNHVGVVIHKNITGSQNVEGHALYLVKTNAKNLTVGNVVVNGSPTGASAVKLHGHKNFTIGSISGSGMGSIANFRDGSTGVVGKISVNCDTSVFYSGITYHVLAFGAGTKVVIGVADIEMAQDAAVSNTVFQSTSSAELHVKKLILKGTTASAAQPNVARATSLGSIVFDQPHIEFPNSTCTNYAFDLQSYTKAVIDRPYYNTGGTAPLVLRNTYAAGQRYTLNIDPNLIVDGLTEGAVICTANTNYFVNYVGEQFTPSAITGGFPICTHVQTATITQGAATDVRQLRRTTPGQTITLINGDGNSNLFHNGNPGQDGNILTTTGATIPRGSWSVAHFKRVGSDMMMLGYR